jgi:putative oxidoreductase
MSVFQSAISPSAVNPRPEQAAFVLRIALAAVLISHGALKLFVFGIEGSSAFLASVGFPGWFIYPALAIELLGGVLIALGLWVRPLAALAALLLLGTVYVHAPNGWLFTSANGGWEYPLFLTVASVAVAIAGEGAWALRLPKGQAKPAQATGAAAPAH